MKAKDIENRLNNGGRLIYRNNAYFPAWYYVGNENVESRLSVTQFNKYVATCSNSDTSEKGRAWFKGDSYRVYYWR